MLSYARPPNALTRHVVEQQPQRSPELVAATRRTLLLFDRYPGGAAVQPEVESDFLNTFRLRAQPEIRQLYLCWAVQLAWRDNNRHKFQISEEIAAMPNKYTIYLENQGTDPQIFWCFLAPPQELAGQAGVFAIRARNWRSLRTARLPTRSESRSSTRLGRARATMPSAWASRSRRASSSTRSSW